MKMKIEKMCMYFMCKERESEKWYVYAIFEVIKDFMMCYVFCLSICSPYVPTYSYVMTISLNNSDLFVLSPSRKSIQIIPSEH